MFQFRCSTIFWTPWEPQLSQRYPLCTAVVWAMTRCNLVSGYQRFGGINRLHFQGAISIYVVGGYLEGGCDTFLLNVGKQLQTMRHRESEYHNPHFYRRNLKFNIKLNSKLPPFQFNKQHYRYVEQHCSMRRIQQRRTTTSDPNSGIKEWEN